MSIYTQTQTGKHTFSGEVETENLPDLVLVDELTREDLPFKLVKRDLNKDLRFCSAKVLTEYLTILNQD